MGGRPPPPSSAIGILGSRYPHEPVVRYVEGWRSDRRSRRAAAALIKLSHVPANELPARIQFRSDSWAIVKTRAEVTVRDAGKWSEVSHSTNKDGVDIEGSHR